MPQKKNPTVLEYIKWRSGHIVGLLMGRRASASREAISPIPATATGRAPVGSGRWWKKACAA
nr:hypothetical protein [Pseudomonas sp. 58 R 12]